MYLSKVAGTPAAFGARLGLTPLEFVQIFGVRKLDSLCYHAALLLDTVSSRYDTIPACDGQMDRRTDRQTDT